jgi:hypothetical protein
MKSPKNMKKWGFPDGRDRSLYPKKTSDWSDDRWRWEFTRRREDYCEDFERAAAARVKQLRQIEPYQDEKFDPEDFNKENPNFFAFVDDKEIESKYGYNILLHPKWDFERFPVPFCDSPRPAGLCVGFGKGFVPFKVDIMLPPVIETVPVPEGSLAMVLDLSKKLEPQIREMTAQALVIQKRKFGDISARRKHRGTWIRYLRVIDARAAGASLKELADIAASDEGDQSVQTAHQVWDAACRLMLKWPA